MYISDLITTDIIDTWCGNNRILIKASCGTGKTKFVTEKFYGYAKQRHKKILILNNRRFLKQQTEKECEGKEDVITVKTYQSLEQNLDYANRVLHEHDYIVADEAHYFFNDSVLLNSTTYKLMPILKEIDRPAIFITATPEVLERWMTFNKEDIFDIKKPPQVDQFYYFRNPAVIGKLLELIPPDEKIIYFCSNLQHMEELYNQYKEYSMFVCSESQASYYKKYVDENAVENEIVGEETFTKRILFTTSVLDNGVNFKDMNIKHIICDYADITTVIQCTGRKRYDGDDDTINLYIMDYIQEMLNGRIGLINEFFRRVSDTRNLSSVEYAQKYESNYYHNGLILSTGINGNFRFIPKPSVQLKYQYDLELYDEIFNKYDNRHFAKCICDKLGLDNSMLISLEKEYDNRKIAELFNEIKDKKLFDEDIEAIKNFFKNDLMDGCSLRSIGGINQCLSDKELYYYYIESKQEKSYKDGNRDKTYWMLKINWEAIGEVG